MCVYIYINLPGGLRISEGTDYLGHLLSKQQKQSKLVWAGGAPA